MTESVKRADMLRVAGLVRPALASADYIPALTHVKFDGEYATAYNDLLAVAVRCDTAFRACLPGDLLIRALGSFAGDTVAMSADPKSGGMLLSSGRSKIVLPTLPADAHPFRLDEQAAADEHALTKQMVRAIERCLMSAGGDPKHPAQMGVTLAAEGGAAVFYSTDNLTMSRAATGAALALPGDTPVILPTAFCEQVVALGRAFPEAEAALVVAPGAVFADFVEKPSNAVVATAFHRMLVDLEPMDYGGIFRRHADPAAAALQASMQAVPDALDAALGRALLVLARESVKTTAAWVKDGTLHLHSESALGVSDEEVPFVGDRERKLVDPALLARGLKATSRMSLLKTGVALAGAEGDGFLHLVAYVSS